jgi:hypothetical protein
MLKITCSCDIPRSPSQHDSNESESNLVLSRAATYAAAQCDPIEPISPAFEDPATPCICSC